MDVKPDSRHIVVLRRGQFCTYTSSFLPFNPQLHQPSIADWFDVVDDNNRPVLTEREVLRNLQAIVQDADKTERSEVCIPLLSFILFYTYLIPPTQGRPRRHRCPLY